MMLPLPLKGQLTKTYQEEKTSMRFKKTPPFIYMPVLLLAFILTVPSSLLGQPYSTGHFQHTFIDPERDDRPILTEVYYPINGNDDKQIAEGSFPLLVFGHGFVMTWSAYENLWAHFVPHGYIMAFPRTESGFSPSHIDFGRDIAFLTGAIQALHEDPASVLFGGLNGRSAVMGHSMGGGASVLATALNENIDALLALAPAETSPSAIAAAENIGIPSLIFAGSSDDVTPEETHQLPIYEALVSDSKTYVRILGGGHCYFANYNFNCSFGEAGSSGNITVTREEQQETTEDFATPWLDYFLKDDCDEWLRLQDSLATSPRIESIHQSIISDPQITTEEEMLVSTPANTYQWLLNGEPVEEAVNQSFYPILCGHYQVKVTYHNLCAYVSEPTFFYRPGDANTDGIVDVLDVLTSMEYFLYGEADPFCFENADVDQNGIIDVLDMIAIVNIYMERGQ